MVGSQSCDGSKGRALFQCCWQVMACAPQQHRAAGWGRTCLFLHLLTLPPSFLSLLPSSSPASFKCFPGGNQWGPHFSPAQSRCPRFNGEIGRRCWGPLEGLPPLSPPTRQHPQWIPRPGFCAHRQWFQNCFIKTKMYLAHLTTRQIRLW